MALMLRRENTFDFSPLWFTLQSLRGIALFSRIGDSHAIHE